MLDEQELRALVPAVIGVLVRRGADFASAEDAVQDALIRALEAWPEDPPRDPKAWLVAVAWPREYGGRGVSPLQWLVFEEEYYAAGGPGRVNQNGTDLLATTLFRHGTEEQLARMVAMRGIASEKQLGSYGDLDAARRGLTNAIVAYLGSA